MKLIEKRLEELNLKTGFQEISVDKNWVRADVVIRLLNEMERRAKVKNLPQPDVSSSACEDSFYDDEAEDDRYLYYEYYYGNKRKDTLNKSYRSANVERIN